MRALTSVLALSVLLAVVPAMAQQASLGHQDREFTDQAMAANMAEVEMGKLAQSHAAAPAVREFAQRMVTDHTQNSQQITAFARRHGMTPPMKLPPEEQRKIDGIARMQGEQFDNAYMPLMVQDHKADIESFKKEISSGTNAELKDYARQTLPVLEQHLTMAQDVSRPQGAAMEPKERKGE
jgi:putative membrane protein